MAPEREPFSFKREARRSPPFKRKRPLPNGRGPRSSRRSRSALKALVIIEHARLDHLHGLFGAVDAIDRDIGSIGLVGPPFIRQEIMAEALDERIRDLAKIPRLAPDRILVEDRDDLIVRLAVIDHEEAAHGPRAQEDIGAINRAFRENTDIERIAIADFGPAELRDAITAISARDKAIKRRGERVGGLRSIDVEISRLLINLPFHRIERRDLNISVEDLRRVRAHREPVPGMRAVSFEECFHALGLLLGWRPALSAGRSRRLAIPHERA